MREFGFGCLTESLSGVKGRLEPIRDLDGTTVLQKQKFTRCLLHAKEHL